MKRKTLWVVGCIALLCAIAFGISAQTKTPPREHWEYQTVGAWHGQGSSFNRLGNEGWELTTVTCSGDLNQCAYYFKRRK
ncbi:MAG: hypothetical protein WAM70_12145 [Pyrinomonadaceae bacterium]